MGQLLFLSVFAIFQKKGQKTNDNTNKSKKKESIKFNIILSNRRAQNKKFFFCLNNPLL